jgi:very-short-patch-repair endonuclease
MVEADKRDLITPSMLELALARAPRRPGAKAMRAVLTDWTFTLTDSELERRFIPIAKRAGLPKPECQAEVNGFKVDFFFEEIGLVVECDGGRFHRTAAQQTKDRIRDQHHLMAGLTPVRFTHAQIATDPSYVAAVLSGSSARQTAA